MQFTHPELLQKLEKSGFSDKEARVYLCLLELSGAYPSKVANYTGLNRSTVYHVLLTLSVRGLVNEIEKKNKLFYQIEKPEKVVRYAESQVGMARECAERAQSVLPDIEGLYSAHGERPRVTYYEGAEGLLAIYTDHISVNRPYEMLAFANAAELRQFLPPKFFNQYVREKEKIGITTRGILPDTEENRTFSVWRYEHTEKKIRPEMRFVKEEQFPFVGEITVYGENKVSIANFEKGKMIGTVIEDEAIHRIMKTIFELSWKSTLVKD